MAKSPFNTYLALVFNHKKESLVRIANQFLQCFDIQAEPNELPKREPSENLAKETTMRLLISKL